MELEKTLYRVHDRILSSKNISRILQIVIVVFALLSLFLISNFIYLNASFEGKKSNCIQLNDTKQASEQASEYLQLANKTLYNIKVLDSENIKLNMLVSSKKEFITIEPAIRDELNISFAFPNISYSCYYSNAFAQMMLLTTSVETLFLNDLVSSLGGDIAVKNNETNETWYWGEKAIIRSHEKQEKSYITRFFNCFIDISKILLGVFIQSAVASLYIKMTIICAPVFIVMMLDCMSAFGNREIQPQVLARAFPWIGQYLNLLDRNQRSKSSLLYSFFFMLLLFYFIYLSCVYIGSFLLFFKSTPKGLDEDFFGLMAMNEFLSMLCLRTRSSLYFVPKFIILYYVGFLYYVQQSCYGFFYLGFQITFFLSFLTFASFLYLFEIPALTWSPLSPYTPTVDRPRCFYQPLFQMGWTNDIPQIWSMFYPMHGRRFFQIPNLALVDRNYPLLNNLFQQQDVEMQEVPPQQQVP